MPFSAIFVSFRFVRYWEVIYYRHGSARPTLSILYQQVPATLSLLGQLLMSSIDRCLLFRGTILSVFYGVLSFQTKVPAYGCLPFNESTIVRFYCIIIIIFLIVMTIIVMLPKCSFYLILLPQCQSSNRWMYVILV